jgi:hypothetical protein
MAGDQQRPTRAEQREAAYLERLRRDAEGFRADELPANAEIDEIRRWEGSTAAEQALRDRNAKLAQPYTKISRPTTRSVSRVAMPMSGIMPTNAFAIVSLVLGLLGGGILGIIFGHVALAQIDRTGESGRGLAQAGLILGYLALAVTVIWAVIVFAISAR